MWHLLWLFHVLVLLVNFHIVSIYRRDISQYLSHLNANSLDDDLCSIAKIPTFSLELNGNSRMTQSSVRQDYPATVWVDLDSYYSVILAVPLIEGVV
jgi:hypothetical protein